MALLLYLHQQGGTLTTADCCGAAIQFGLCFFYSACFWDVLFGVEVLSDTLRGAVHPAADVNERRHDRQSRPSHLERFYLKLECIFYAVNQILSSYGTSAAYLFVFTMVHLNPAFSILMGYI